MKIFNATQTRAWDAYTIAREPVASIELMNRAARVFTDFFTADITDTERPIWIYCGTGNNGGDGIAAARLLHQRFYGVKVWVCGFNRKHSLDFDAQLALLPPHGAIAPHFISAADQLAPPPPEAVLIDALFGSGLTRPLEGEWSKAVQTLNDWPNEVWSIDYPSGLADPFQGASGTAVQATRTFSFETPKLAFFFPENDRFTGDWAFGSIGLHPEFAAQTETPFRYITKDLARSMLRPRPKFGHKGVFGHALLIAGGKGKMGAAVLAARACLRSGAGLLSVHAPACGTDILQTAAPEAMCSIDEGMDKWQSLPDLRTFNAIGVGPGVGTAGGQVLAALLEQALIPIVLDADALNMLAQDPVLLQKIPSNSILTPHPKEFDRLFGPSADSFERNALARLKAQELGLYIILKGAHTAVACPDGACWFNSSGNPGMAKGGSGDALTGLLTGLLAQGYSPLEACLLGVYLHGLAGDCAAAARTQQGMHAGDIVDFLPEAWKMK